MTLVIAPNKQQFDRFARQEAERVAPHAIDLKYASRPMQLQGYRGELIIVNADQIRDDILLDYAMLHIDKGGPVRYVDLP